MLKKALAVATVAGALSFVAAPALANSVCVDLYLNANGTEVVNQTQCIEA